MSEKIVQEVAKTLSEFHPQLLMRVEKGRNGFLGAQEEELEGFLKQMKHVIKQLKKLEQLKD